MFNKMGAELNIQFVIFVLLTGFIFSQFLPSFRGKDTNYNLINDLSDDAFSCSSFRDNFFPYLAREKNSKNRMIDSPQAWCPKNEVGPNSKEYIQVDFKDLKALSYLVTNGLDNGNDGFFVSFFYLDYQRENGSEWHRYKNESDHKLIEGNVDSRNMKITKFKSNIIARRIRIIPISNITKTVCLKFTFYGGNFNDGVVEYSMPQGDIFTIYQIKFPLKDRIYDGIEHRKNDNVLRRGIGQLMDNIINENSIASINNGEVNFVGWQNFDKNRKIEMIFRFDKVRIMKGVSFHILNDLKKNISIFSSARFEFSIGGEIYGKCAKNITFKHNADLKLKTARWLHVNLSDSPAKFVRVTLEFRLQWIVLTEVQFTTNVPKEEYPTEKQGSDSRSKSKPNSMFPTSKINNLLICFCVIITFVGLMCIISICILRFRRQRKRRIKGKPLHSIRYGNMPINNVIPIPVVSSSNGGIYKPIPNGIYDCMPGFQSQTLNVRKVTNYPNQQLFGTYSNRKNSNSNQNPGIAPINQDNYNATLSQIVGQPNVALYCPENKRASYDGSYGTSSNPEYSNGSLDKKTLPLHLVPLSPTMYEQYKLNPNNHHGLPNPPHQFNLMSPVLQSYQQDSRQTFVDNFPVNSLAPSMINNYVQPFIYQPANLTIDSSIIRWPNELYELLEKHSRFDTCLQSPVGGSTVLREKFDGNESFTMKDYEEIIIEKLSKIDIEKMELQKLIGSGRYGSIKKGIYNGSVVVVKAINRDCVPSVRISFLKMISDLMKISSKNFVKIVGYCDYSTTDEGEEFPFQDILLKPSISCIIMQHTHQGYLHKFIRRHSRPVSSALINATNNKPGSDTSCTSVEDEPEESSSKPLLSHSCLIYIAAQISDGMSFLEHEGLIHRDLATRNCIVGPRLSILITDTAMDNNKFQKDYITINKVLSDLSTIGMDIDVNINFYQPSVSLPLQWMSWEAVLKGRYSSKSDVWSFGVLFWDLLTFCQFRPYFCVPQNLTNIDSTANYVKCLSLLFNFKCLEHGLDNSLMPNNESLSQIRKGTSWTTPLPLPVPSQIINISSDRRLANIQTPRMTHQDSSVNRILDSNREIRDLISSCWSTEPSNRPKFKDISIFLKQKINNFNVEEEYQYIQTNVRRS